MIEEVGSYNQCEKFIFGRQSFGGCNPEVERNVKNGTWIPFYMDSSEKKEKDEDDNSGNSSSDHEMDVNDEEMAATFGSIIGTIGRKFLPKSKKNKKTDRINDSRSLESSTIIGDSKSNQKNWKNNKKNDKDGNSKNKNFGSHKDKDGRFKIKANRRLQPSETQPSKKMKFMKPNED